MEEVIKKYNIRKDKSGLYRLNDIVKNMIKSKNPSSYMDRIKNKKRNKKSKNFYIDESQFLAILNKSRSKICKDALKILSPPEEIEPSEAITIIDIANNNFLFEGNKITLIYVNNEIWFKGKDIAQILKYQDTEQSLKQNIDDEDRIRFTDFDTRFENGYSNTVTQNGNLLNTVKKQHPHTIFINESGFYSLIMRSKMKAAKKFQRWVTKEVLPSIRKKGFYNLNQEVPPQIMYDLNDYINKSCFYIINIKDNIYKYGITDNMIRRANDHKYDFNFTNIVKIYELDNFTICRNIENKMNLLVKQLDIHCYFNKEANESSAEYKKNASKECFYTTNEYTLEYIYTFIEKYIESSQKFCNDLYINLEIEKEKTKQLTLQLEIKKLDSDKTKQLALQLEIKKLDFTKPTKSNNKQNDINSLIIDEESDESIINIPDDDSSESDESIHTPEDENQYIENINKCIDCDIDVFKTSTRCIKCESKRRFNINKHNRPAYKQLLQDLEGSSYVQVGKKYGVSDNAIRKWIKTYEKYDVNI